MGWQKDGSGLDVKRIRGKTLPQSAVFGIVRADGWGVREARRHYKSGWACNVAYWRRWAQEERRRNRARRAHRRAKRAIRRLRAQFACVLPVVPRPMPPSFDQWVDGLAASMGVTRGEALDILRKAARKDLEVSRGLGS